MYQIPDVILEIYQKSLDSKGRIQSRKFNALATQQCIEWLDNTSPYSRSLIFRLISLGYKQFDIFKCEVCGKPLSEDQIKNQRKYCSHKCSASTDEFKQKIKQTNLKKYGTEFPSQSKEINDKRKATNLEKYGVEDPCKSELINQKRKATNLEKYGVEDPSKNSQVKQKIVQTNLQKYGVENVSQSKRVQKHMLETYGSTTPFGSALIREKSKQTIIERYGVDNPLKDDQIKNKVQQTNLFRYGYKVANQNPQIHQKGIETCLKRYGVENPAHIPSVKRASEQTRRAKYYDLFVLKLAQKNIELITDKQTYCNDIDVNLTYKCKVCGNQWESDVTNYQRVLCEECYKQPFSQGEIKIREFIKSICKHEIIYNDRTTLEGKELDIWIPDLNIAIEFNGNYWHSDLFKDKDYHQQKTLKCREKGIRLIHIFEHEFTNKPQSVYNLLQSALGSSEVVYGRHCTVEPIDQTTYLQFCEKWHFSGSVKANLTLGLKYKGVLISVVGFGNSRYRQDEYELYRYCCDPHYKVIGGFSKLIKHSGASKFVSYVDLAHFSGSGYQSIGCKLLSTTEPNYVWVGNKGVYSRYQTQKHNLPNILNENYDPQLTEDQNMTANHFMKVYDSGNLKYEYDASQINPN